MRDKNGSKLLPVWHGFLPVGECVFDFVVAARTRKEAVSVLEMKTKRQGFTSDELFRVNGTAASGVPRVLLFSSSHFHSPLPAQEFTDLLLDARQVSGPEKTGRSRKERA